MPYRRPPPKMPPPLPVEALMRDEFEQRPFGGRGGIVGEFATHPPPGERQPPPPPPQPFVIPEWDTSSFVDELPEKQPAPEPQPVEPEPETPTYPAAKQPAPKRTPNLDKARALLDELPPTPKLPEPEPEPFIRPRPPKPDWSDPE